MKLVIDIDDEVYKRFIDDYVRCPDIIYAVRKGVPLPKGYGRLISEKDVLSVILFSKLFDNAKVGEVKEALLNIPTIIEADKETQDENSD